MKFSIKSHYLQMDIVAVDLDKIDLDKDINFGEDDPDTIILVRLLVWWGSFEKIYIYIYICKELMSVAWHPKRW